MPYLVVSRLGSSPYSVYAPRPCSFGRGLAEWSDNTRDRPLQKAVKMGPLLIAAFVVAFAILSLYDPRLYRKLLAPLCSMREDDLPPFPRAAALALLLFSGIVVLAPGVLRAVGSYMWISQRFLDWVVAIAFLIVGLGLAISPRVCLHILKWPQRQGSSSVVVTRVVGIFLLVGSALFTRSEILRR